MSFIPGANVGPYRIVEQAERNGIATTYTAYQPSQGRYVSVVVVPTIDRDDVALQRQYQRQIELALSMRHPNVLTVLDHGEHLGVPFVVTELLEAEPLAERLGAPWPLPEVVRVLKPIAAGLDFAHGYGAVHGEVRPSLVLLTPDGTPILSGFGQSVRRFADAEGRPLTLEPGRRTVSIPAEIGRAQAADRRGLALIAYEMLTGRTVDGDSRDLERPLPPTQLGSPLLTPPVERAFLRELSGEPSDRYASASAFMDDLAATVAAPSSMVASSTPPPPPMTAAPPPGGESRRRLITVAVIFTALAVLGSLALLLRGGDPSRPIAATRTPAVDPAAGSPVTGSPVIGSGTGAGSSPSTSGSAGTAAGAGSAVSGASAGAAAGAATPTRPPHAQVVVSTPDNVQPLMPTPLPAGAARPTVASGPPPAGAPVGPGSSGSRPIAGPPASAPAGAAGAPTTPAGAPANTAGAATAPNPAAGAPAPVSTRIPVAWRVTGDPSGKWAYDERGRVAATADDGASLVLFPETVEDVNFSALVNTSSCQATLVFRAQDAENLLMAIYIPDGIPNPNSAGGGIWLYQRVEGLDVPIRAIRPNSMKRAGEPARLKIETVGPQINVSLDNELAIQAVDTASRPGKLGLMIYSASGRQCEATFGDIQR